LCVGLYLILTRAAEGRGDVGHPGYGTVLLLAWMPRASPAGERDASESRRLAFPPDGGTAQGAQSCLAVSVLAMHAESRVSAVGGGSAGSVCVAMEICTASAHREGEFAKCVGICRGERCSINVN